MGSRNIDRIPPEVWRERAPSVWLMAAYGWSASSRCWKCGARRPLDLIAVGRSLGPQYSLWDRASRCRHIATCWGLVTYFGRPPGTHQDVHLCSPKVQRDRAARLERARLAWAARQPNPDDPRNFPSP